SGRGGVKDVRVLLLPQGGRRSLSRLLRAAASLLQLGRMHTTTMWYALLSFSSWVEIRRLAMQLIAPESGRLRFYERMASWRGWFALSILGLAMVITSTSACRPSTDLRAGASVRHQLLAVFGESHLAGVYLASLEQHTLRSSTPYEQRALARQIEVNNRRYST